MLNLLGLWTQIPPRNVTNQLDHALYCDRASFDTCAFDLNGKGLSQAAPYCVSIKHIRSGFGINDA